MLQNNRCRLWVLVIALGVSCSSTARTVAQTQADVKVADSIDVLNGFLSMPNDSIPQAILADAQAVVIVPRVIKGSFIVGARRGEGVVMFRDGQGNWQAPAFVTLTGGNVGWQVGIQATDLVLVFKTRTSVEKMLAGAFTIGGDAAAAAGPVGRNASVATDAALRAEVYSYSRSRGLFAGVSLDGSVLKLDQVLTNSYYQPQGATQAPQVPATALQLVELLRAHAQGPSQVQSPSATQSIARQTDMSETDQARAQLAAAAQGLYPILDRNWQSYLALPAEVLQSGAHSDAAQLRAAISRFDALLADTRYQALTSRTEFQTVAESLKRYEAALAKSSATLNLPAPPQSAPNR